MANHPHNSDRPEPKKVRKALEKGDMEALGLALTHRQRRFAEEYIIDFNGTAAAIRSGYSPKWADRQAHILREHEGVNAYIDHLSRKKVDSLVSVSPDWVVQKVIATIEKAEGINNLTAALRGLELMARHLGMLTDKTEITGKDGGAIELEQRTREESTDFINQLKLLSKRAKDETEKKEVIIV